MEETNYPRFSTEAVNKLFMEWEHNKHVDVMAFRDGVHSSIIDGSKGTEPKVKWVDQFDFSSEGFLKN